MMTTAVTKNRVFLRLARDVSTSAIPDHSSNRHTAASSNSALRALSVHHPPDTVLAALHSFARDLASTARAIAATACRGIGGGDHSHAPPSTTTVVPVA